MIATVPTRDQMNAAATATAHAHYPAHLLDLSLPADMAAHLGLSAGPLTLRRVWPQAPDHFGLEYRDVAGKVIPGQWVGEDAKFAKIVKGTKRVAMASQSGTVITLPKLQILLQANGADRCLVGLSGLLDEPSATMVLHRPERRAVVRLERQGTVTFAKVVRPNRIHELASIMLAVHALAAGHFRVPPITDLDVKHGILYLAKLPGHSLNDLLAGATATQAAAVAGVALRQLHKLPVPSQAQPHTATAEMTVIEKWLERLRWLAPTLATPILALQPQVCAALVAADSPPVLLHRDYYEKQIFIGEDGNPGLLDFDLLASGEAALDVANALVHFELRASQGICTMAAAQRAQAAFLEGYQPTPIVQQRIQAYADATRLRLACVYACRPYGLIQVQALLAAIGRRVLGRLQDGP